MACAVWRVLAATAEEGTRTHICHGKRHGIISRRDEKCSARSIPVELLNDLVWQDVCEVLTHSDMIAAALYRAQGGQWLPQEPIIIRRER